MNRVLVDQLKVGDKIGVTGAGWDPIPEIKTVARRTATQVVLDDGSRWNKYGRKIGEGNGYFHSYLLTLEEAATLREDGLKKHARLALLREVNDFDWKNVTDEGPAACLGSREGQQVLSAPITGTNDPLE